MVYVLNPYHLLEVHARCSLAELLVSASLPLLLLAVYWLSEPGKRRIAVAALLFAIVALTNIPLAVVTAYGAFAFVVALTLARKSGIAPVARFAMAGLLGAGVAGFFLLPAWFEKRWVLASVHAVVPPEAQFVRLNGLPYDRWAWALAGRYEAGLIVLGILAWVLCRKTKPRDAVWAFTVLFSISTIMVLPISAIIWRFAPALIYVQFPWRWLGILGLAMSFVAAAVQQSRKGLVLATGVCVLGVAMLAAFTALINTKADVLLPSLKRSFTEGRGYLGWPFVLPRDIKINEVGIPVNLTPGDPLVSEISQAEVEAVVPQDYRSHAPVQDVARIAIARWSAEARGGCCGHAKAGLDPVPIVSLSRLERLPRRKADGRCHYRRASAHRTACSFRTEPCEASLPEDSGPDLGNRAEFVMPGGAAVDVVQRGRNHGGSWRR